MNNMKFLIYLIISLLVVFSEQKSTPEDDHYVAAVVEYIVQRNTENNLRNYIDLIRDAASQNADVVVFPEMTLTSGISIEVPIHGSLKDFSVPALYPDLYHQVLVELSLAARQTEVYVVVNFEEILDCSNAPGEYCPDLGIYKFNTNVVFDRNGAIIDRYRKINLFGEFTRTPALKPDLGVFTTDFGVTFGHYVCFDLMFQVPSVQIVQKHNLTDIIFTTMWFSELPYLTAVEIQEAYAYTNNVNFLASGANNVNIGSAGSGIYSGKAGALISIMPGSPTTRLLVSKVPKIPGNVTLGSYVGSIYDSPTIQDRLYLKVDLSLRAHVSRLIEEGNNDFTLTDKDVNCNFRVKFNYNEGEEKPYFRAFVHDGFNIYARRSIGVVGCSVVSCRDETVKSCPFKYNSNERRNKIEVLDIKMQTMRPQYNDTLKCDNIIYYATTVRTNKFPLDVSNYTYSSLLEEKGTQNGGIQDGGCSPKYGKSNNKRVLLSLKLNRIQTDLVTFGIWGRVYNRDSHDKTTATLNDVNEYKEIENVIFSAGDNKD